MLSPALLVSILTPGPLPDLSFSISMSHCSRDAVSPGSSFPPSSVPGNNHSQNKDMLRNTFFFQRPIQCSSSRVLEHTEVWLRVTLPAWQGRKMAR